MAKRGRKKKKKYIKIWAFVQLLLMPMLVPALGEEKLLSIGLFFSCAHVSFLSLCGDSLSLAFHIGLTMSTSVNSWYCHLLITHKKK